MKVTDPQVILNGEKDLIASVQKNLDLDAVRDLLKERLTVKALSPKGGKIVVHDNDVAFRLDYEINLDGSLLFDRNGNLLENGAGKALEDKPEEDAAPKSDPDDIQDNDIRDNEPGLEIDDLEDDFGFDQDDSDILEADDGDELNDLNKSDDIENLSVGELPDIGLDDEDKESGQDIVDDDINDILQESRNFWEKKKE